MKSCIYEGFVRHKRSKPVENAFRYTVFMVYLDLAEADHVFSGKWLWSTKGFNIAYFRRKDHLGDPAVPLDSAVRDLVEDRLGRRPAGPIRLLTHLRYFGHNFNPVSFYYCYDAGGLYVDMIVAEIHNTPWGELFCYVLGKEQGEDAVTEKWFQFSKNFHVSPFMDMNFQYKWRFSEPEETLKVNMINYKDKEKLFEAELVLERRQMNSSQLARVLIKYPFMTMKVVGAIYWQALRLWLKGVPFYTHPSKRSKDREA